MRGMMGGAKGLLVVMGAAALVGCGDDDSPSDTSPDTSETVDTDDTNDSSDVDPGDTAEVIDTTEQAMILGVAETERFELEGLTAPVHVVRTEGSTPHIYAQNRIDLARVLGFIQARDRYFFMDLQRRLGLGTLTDLFGEVALSNDIESRGTGMPLVTDRLVANMSPDFKAYLQAFADGVNDYIAAVAAETLTPPTETQFASLLGYDSASEMMKPFAVRDVVALVTVFMYSTNFETDDLGRTAAALRLDDQFNGVADEALRKAGYLDELWHDTRGLFVANSTTGFGKNGALGLEAEKSEARAAGSEKSAKAPDQRIARTPRAMIERLHQKLYDRMLRLGKDRDAGFGSNIWAVAGTHTADGAALLANDGHLELAVPPLGYGAALDTRLFGGGDIHQLGGWLGNFPVMVGGTNGDVAWGGVNPVLDITDYYREEVRIGADGKPDATYFEGQWRPLTKVDEDYVVADIALLNSTGRTETWSRWETFDGRLLVSVEGRPATSVADAGEGEAVVNMLGDLVVPDDIDNDGVVTGVTVDHVAFDATKWPEAMFEVGLADDVEGVRQAARGYVGAALFTGAADKDGSILYTSFQAVPCRGYLPRVDGAYPMGGDPTMLLDGTTYKGFSIQTDAAGKADETAGSDDPYKCVIGHDEMPHAIDPAEGFIFNANNDPAGLTDDGEERNDRRYLGGPWASVRAHTIKRSLEAATADKQATAQDMIDLQANVESRLGEVFAPYVVQAIGKARAATLVTSPTVWEARLAALYESKPEALSEVASRLSAWGERGYVAFSGVDTFYVTPSADEKKDAAATMIFNSSFRRFLSAVWDDEGIVAQRWGGESRVATMARYLAGRGAGNPAELTSWSPSTLESVFFDRLGTEEIETSDELMVAAVLAALEWLESPGAQGAGGFGSADMDTWLWGLRHQVRFESILSGYIGDDPALSLITGQFAITTDIHPLAPSLPAGDPRRGLRWFPRGGDQWAVDAANPGLGGDNYTHGSGPAMRIWFALKDGHVEGGFVLPGGQSGITTSPFFADQTRLWLGNEYLPVRFAPADVAAGATGRELYVPR